MSQATPAFVRTIVPMLVGTVIAFLTAHNINVDGDTGTALTTGLSGLFSAVYYGVMYALETRWPVFGLLLGSTARPTYRSKTPTASIGPASATPGAPEDRL